MQKINQKYISSVVKKALDEDLKPMGDITTKLIKFSNKKIKGRIIAKQNGVIAGIEFCKKAFKLIGKEFDSILGKTVNKHILNSNGVINFNEHQMGGVRIGIGLLGAAKHKELTQISSLVSVITQIKSIKKDEAIGYGFSFAAKKDMILL